MRRKGVFVFIIMCILITQTPQYAEAGRSSSIFSWQCGLRIGVEFENSDYWITDSVSEIFFTLTLVDAGNVTDFYYLIFRIWLVTETIDYGQSVINDLWSAEGDAVRIVSRFVVTPEQINNAEWDTYYGTFFYNFSLGTTVTGSGDMELYTLDHEGTTLTMSTLQFMSLWPFPPILVMGALFWIGFIVVRKFNSRYDELREIEGKTRW